MMQKIENSSGLKNRLLSDDLWTAFLVEDDQDDRAMAERVLKESPYIDEIINVPDSSRLFECLAEHANLSKKARDQRKLLVVLDIHMPGVDGLALLEQLRSNPDTSGLPVVMITGDQDREKIFQSYRRNASCFITKPITKKHLTDIHTILEYGIDWQRAN